MYGVRGFLSVHQQCNSTENKRELLLPTNLSNLSLANHSENK